ncbi:hypothetical protein T439DRAFT_326040 [Meredithblackwellia eburnea MCA 4105]
MGGVGGQGSSIDGTGARYTAHVATDDKAILAMLHQESSSASTSQGCEEFVQATAPDAEVDGDGFEIHPPPSEEEEEEEEEGTTCSTTRAVGVAGPSLFPLPPRAVTTTFSYSSPSSSTSLVPSISSLTRTTPRNPRSAAVEEPEEEETGPPLPVYVPREMVEPSAPPAEDEDDGEDEGEGEGEMESAAAVARAWGEDRQEHAEI